MTISGEHPARRTHDLVVAAWVEHRQRGTVPGNGIKLISESMARALAAQTVEPVL